MNSKEKADFVNEASEAVNHPIVENVVAELIENIQNNPNAPLKLLAYGVHKVAYHTAVVARAEALGIDPNELKL